MKQQELLVPVIVVAVIAGTAGFFGGMKYQQSKQLSFQLGQGGRNGMVFQGGRGSGAGGAKMMNGSGNGFRPVSGQIISVDNSSVTVKLTDGSTKIVIVPTSVTINKAATGSKDDLKVGETVAVFGSSNSDGSVTAQNIQLDPIVKTQTNGGTTSPSGAPKP